MDSQFIKKTTQKKILWVSCLLILVLFFVVKCTFFSSEEEKLDTEPLVVTAQARVEPVPVYLQALGTVTAEYNVTVRTQVSGRLEKVWFREGQMVKAGQLLAEIDARPFEAQLLQYQGQLVRDQALLANAKIDLNRYQKLWREDSVAKQVLDTQAALVKQDEGLVKVDQGLIEGVTVNLSYCRITSPIDGRVGLNLVDAGNTVQPSDTTGLAVINSMNPIFVTFPISEDDVPQVMEQFTAGKQLETLAFDREQLHLLGTGKLVAVDSQIDSATGTLKLKANFTNDRGLLFPNQFVNIKLLVNTLQHAVVVPTAAIQIGADGSYVYVLKANHRVKVQSVKTGIIVGNDTTILAGINPIDRVVVEGGDKLSDGVRVRLAEVKSKSP